MLFNYLSKGYCNRKALATKVFPKYCERPSGLLARFAVEHEWSAFQAVPVKLNLTDVSQTDASRK